MKEEKDLKKEETKQSNSKSKTKNTSKVNSKGKGEGKSTVNTKNNTKKTETAKKAKTVSKSKDSNGATTTKKSTTSKRTNTKKKEDKTIDIAFIENDEKADVVVSSEEAVEINNEKMLIDQKALEKEQLDVIKEAIKKSKKEKKSKVNKQVKYKKILKNILIGIVETLYFLILIVTKEIVPTIEYITALKILTIVEMIASIIIFEVSYKKDSEELFLHGVEMMVVAGATLVYLHFFSMQSNILNIIGAVIAGIIIIYYLIKSIIIAVIKNKNK